MGSGSTRVACGSGAGGPGPGHGRTGGPGALGHPKGHPRKPWGMLWSLWSVPGGSSGRYRGLEKFEKTFGFCIVLERTC